MSWPEVALLEYSKHHSPVEKKLTNFLAIPNQNDLAFMKELLEASKVVPIIDRCYMLREVAEAVQYYGEGHTRGKVIITIDWLDF